MDIQKKKNKMVDIIIPAKEENAKIILNPKKIEEIKIVRETPVINQEPVIIENKLKIEEIKTDFQKKEKIVDFADKILTRKE